MPLAWRGRRACQCVIDATADYERLVRSSLSGYIYQGSYSNAAASAGTHSAGGALDTTLLTDRGVRVASSIGFWPSNRFTWQGFSLKHAHWVLFGCPHAHPSLSRQEDDLRRGDGGLRGGASDIHRKLRPARILTYRQWQAAQKPKKVTYIRVNARLKLQDKVMTVAGVRSARRTGKPSIFTYHVQVWLRKTGFYKSPIDARWGPVTQAAIDNFRRQRLRWSRAESVGPVGINALTRLAQAARSKRIVREK